VIAWLSLKQRNVTEIDVCATCDAADAAAAGGQRNAVHESADVGDSV